MPKRLKFYSTMYDSVQLTSNSPGKYSLFNDNNDTGYNETRKHEPEMVEWLTSKSFFRSLMCSVLRIPFYSTFNTNIRKPIITKAHSKPGDIDILISDRNYPNRSIAIECKKINVELDNDGNDNVNKIKKIQDCKYQIKGLLELGFHKCFLAVIIANNGMKYEKVNYFARNITDQSFQEVYKFPGREEIDKRAGIIFIDLIQPTGESLNNRGVLSICVDKYAVSQVQSEALTQKIRDLL